LRALRFVVIAAISLACQPPPDPPEAVTERFWTAIRTGDLETARDLATAASVDAVDTIEPDRPIERVLIGETLRDETTAVVRTSVVTHRDEGEVRSSFDTHLAWNGESWRVEVEATRRDWTAATFSASMRLLGQALGTSLAELSEAFEEGAAELMQSINEALEESETQRPRRDP